MALMVGATKKNVFAASLRHVKHIINYVITKIDKWRQAGPNDLSALCPWFYKRQTNHEYGIRDEVSDWVSKWPKDTHVHRGGSLLIITLRLCRSNSCSALHLLESLEPVWRYPCLQVLLTGVTVEMKYSRCVFKKKFNPYHVILLLYLFLSIFSFSWKKN